MICRGVSSCVPLQHSGHAGRFTAGRKRAEPEECFRSRWEPPTRTSGRGRAASGWPTGVPKEIAKVDRLPGLDK
ncbi:hypothetical protein BIW11_04415, partial [Tropilaelaps mercedesae]